LRTIKKDPDQRAALRRVKEWTRARFRLPNEAAVLVTEVACGVPGCPPVETVVAFWGEDGERRHFKVFKPASEVAEDDLPPSWMKDRLIADAMLGCECC
jgi:nitrate reductase delta subunit